MSAGPPDIFISYAREDVEWVRPLAAELERRGWSVFWDQRIPAGKSWRNHIGVRLEAARCVIVVWSEAALKSRFVLQEADIGLEREVLLPVLRQSVRPPLGFREVHAANLAAWHPGEPSAEFETFVADLADLLASSQQRELAPDEPEPEQPASLEPSGHTAWPLAEPSEPIISAASKDIDGRQTIAPVPVVPTAAPLADATGPPASDTSPPAPRPEMRRSAPADDAPVPEPLTPLERLRQVGPAPVSASAGVGAALPSPPAPKRRLRPAIVLGLLAVAAVGGVYLAGRSPSDSAKVEHAPPPPPEQAALVQSGAPGQEKGPVPLVQSQVELVAPTVPIVAAKPSRRPRDTFTDTLKDGSPCPFCPEMVVVPAGSFTMGSPHNEMIRNPLYEAQHSVSFERPFALGRYEVTFSQWDACVAAGACDEYRPSDEGWGRGSLPAINVSWQNARAYLVWLTKITGQAYRLPTEAEWEYAARAGTTTPFWTGNTLSPQVNYDAKYTESNSGVITYHTGLFRSRTVAVDDPGFSPNQFGLYHVLGNVKEWTEDCLHPSDGTLPKDGAQAFEASNCSERVLRGGGWADIPDFLRSAFRYGIPPDYRSSEIGFRVARTLQP